MKIVANTKSLLLFGLLSMTGVNAAWAAGSVDDGQQQARFLLGGRNFGVGGGASRAAVESSPGSPVSASSAVDAQEQGRQMILGRPLSRVSSADATADATHMRAAPGKRTVGEGGEGMARRMILRTAS